MKTIKLIIAITSLQILISCNIENKVKENIIDNSQLGQPKEQVTEPTSFCNNCKKSFTGNGFCQDETGNWDKCSDSYIGPVCSKECGQKITAEGDKIYESLGLEKDGKLSSSICKNCNMGKYIDGYCNNCTAASSEEVNKHKQNFPDCEICKGTGLETNYSGESITCRGCNGTGKLKI
jgi:hypothetical protein